MLERLHTGFAGLPGLMRFGLLIVLTGGALDLLYHALPVHWTPIVDNYLGRDGWPIHLVALVGMVVTLAGIFAGRFSLHARLNRHTETERSCTIEQ